MKKRHSLFQLVGLWLDTVADLFDLGSLHTHCIRYCDLIVHQPLLNVLYLSLQLGWEHFLVNIIFGNSYTVLDES
ncbi:hypothetical protein D1872_327930 [compost metagenome]